MSYQNSQAQISTWKNMTADEKARRIAGLHAKRDAWWRSLSPEERTAYISKRNRAIAKAAARRNLARECKSCILCGEEKPRTEFYRHSQTTDGRDGRCKTCMTAYVRERRATRRAATKPQSVPIIRLPSQPQRKGFLYAIKAMLGFSSAA